MKKIKTDLRCLTLLLSGGVHTLSQLSQSHNWEHFISFIVVRWS